MLRYLLAGYLMNGLGGFAFADSLSEAHRAHRTGNYSKAAKLYRLAADSGDADARYALGSMYTYGEGVVADYQKAEKWYRLAAEKGHRDAQYTLGLIYGSGQYGLARDLRKAVQWYRSAAAQGHINALLNLGMIYERGYGQGIRRDYREAAKWYRLAAEKGSPGAQAHLGIMYIRGYGVSRSLILAYMWLKLASDMGLGIAQQGLAEATGEMSSSQISKAKRMAANCKSNNYKNCS